MIISLDYVDACPHADRAGRGRDCEPCSRLRRQRSVLRGLAGLRGADVAWFRVIEAALPRFSR